MPTKLGQNFLINKNIAQKIVQDANIQFNDIILEIGPGKGFLTKELIQKAKKVIAIEIDKNLVFFLKNKFQNQKSVEIVENDVLKINLSKLAVDYQLLNVNYKVVANIPYYITSRIIRFFLEAEFPPAEMILMVQKEVAERIVALPNKILIKNKSAENISQNKKGHMSVLAVAVQYYAEPEILFYVSRESFFPIPKVDSAVIRIKTFKNKTTKEEARKFFQVVRAGFCAKRKTLANNLANSFHLNKKEVEQKITSLGFQPTIRAQELSIDDWKKIVNFF